MTADFLSSGLALLRNVDTAHVSTALWLPLNLWLLWRLVRHGLLVARDPSRRFGRWDLPAASIVFMLLQLAPQGASLALGAGHDAWSGPGDWMHAGAMIRVLQSLTVSLLLVRVVRVVAEFARVVQALRFDDSVLNTLLRQQNLLRIRAARDAAGLAFAYTLLSVLHAHLTEPDRTAQLTHWVAGACLVLPVLSFGCAIWAVSGKFRSEARQLLRNEAYGVDQLERSLSEMATRSVAAQIMVREVFMSEILRTVLAIGMSVALRL